MRINMHPYVHISTYWSVCACVLIRMFFFLFDGNSAFLGSLPAKSSL